MPVLSRSLGRIAAALFSIGLAGATRAGDYGYGDEAVGYGPAAVGLDAGVGGIGQGFAQGIGGLGDGVAAGLGIGTGALGGPAYGFGDGSAPGLTPGWAYGPPPEPRRYVVRQTVYRPATEAYAVPVQGYRLERHTHLVPVTHYRRVVTEEAVPVMGTRILHRTVAVPATVYREVHRRCDCGE